MNLSYINYYKLLFEVVKKKKTEREKIDFLLIVKEIHI